MSFLSNGVPHKYAGCRVVSSQKTCSHAPCRPRRRNLVYALFQQKGFSLLLLSFSAYFTSNADDEFSDYHAGYCSPAGVKRRSRQTISWLTASP